MKTVVVEILQDLGYLLLFLLISLILIGLTKTFIGDWTAGGPVRELLANGLFASFAVLRTGLTFTGLAGFSVISGGWPNLRTSPGGLRGVPGWLLDGGRHAAADARSSRSTVRL